MGAEARRGGGEAVGRRRKAGLARFGEAAAQRLGAFEGVAQRGEVARAAAAEHRRPSARSMSGQPARASRAASRAAAWATKKATMSSRAPMAAGSVNGAASRAASSRPPPAVRVRSTASSRLPRRPPSRARISSRLRRVAASMAMVAPSDWRRGGGQARLAPFLCDLEIVDERAGGGGLGARKGSERLQRRDAPGLAQAAFGGGGVEAHRRQQGGGLRPFGEFTLLREGFGDEEFAGRDLREQRRERAGGRRGDGEGAGRQVEPRRAPCAAGAGDGGEVVVGARVEKAVLYEGSRRHQAHDFARDDGFGAALAGLGGVFGLFADGDLKPARIRRSR